MKYSVDFASREVSLPLLPTPPPALSSISWGKKERGGKNATKIKSKDEKLDGEVNRVKFVSNAKDKDVGKDFLTES